MFGGIGFFREAIMFALLSKSNVFYLRGDDTTRANFENLGMTNFMASENKKGMPYWEVPVDILEHKGELKNWAELAYSIALKHKK
jgi:DNA transformation protein